MPEPLPEEEALPADPFEAELVAYLDGELEPAAVRRVEARLATDPQAQARAAALKKTYDLLDYLPRPEPSATFTTRTLERLPALQATPKQASPQASVQRQSAQPTRASQNGVNVLSPSQSLGRPVRPGATEILSLDEHRTHRILWAAGFLLAVVGFATAGYFSAAAYRSHQMAGRSAGEKDSFEELTLADRRLIENLPLYAAVDDFAFAKELARPEYFGDDPSVAYDSALHVPSVPQEQPGQDGFLALEKAFKQLAPERQQTIRELDRQLYEEPSPQRDRFLHVLEAYRVWLSSLAETDYRAVLLAARPEGRLMQIAKIRERQWIDTLTLSQRNQLNVPNEDLRKSLIEGWKKEEAQRRREWARAQKHPLEVLDLGKVPWPFDDETRKKEVIGFANSAFKLDDPKGSRLAKNDHDRYTSALSFAQQQGGSAWYAFGKIVYEFVRKREFEDTLLPPPADLKLRITELSELPDVYKQNQNLMRRLRAKNLTAYVGKWPEFALEVYKDIPQLHKDVLPKTEVRLPPLGPARVSDFTPPVKRFIETDLFSKLKEDEKRILAGKENRWPEYPKELIQLARQKDLSIPGVMLPGSPKEWEKVYGAQSRQ